MNLITIVGARPQFIKAAPVSAALQASGAIRERILHTGQHFDDDMSEVFFRELGIPHPAWNLGIGGGQHGAMTGAQMAAIEQVLIGEKPDAVLLYGDTNSTLAGALAAAKLHVPVAHVEAGLRSFNRRMPEEINRVLTDHVSQWLFAPTDAAVAHLRREGIAAANVHQVGDVMYDAALRFASAARARAQRPVACAALAGRPFVLATVHRAENTDEPERLRTIVDAFVALAAEIDVVWPLHPRTRKVLAHQNIAVDGHPSLHVVDPLGYLDMIELQSAAELIVTDSGGVQKEAFFFGKPCVTLRDETEWVELVEAGWNRLAPPTSVSALTAAFRAALGSTGRPVHPYGEGDAAPRIARILLGGACLRILLVNHYAGSLRHGMEFRPYYLAREWLKLGHEVLIVAASQSHLRNVAPRCDGGSARERIDGIDYLWLRTPAYRGNGVGRVLNIAVFCLRLAMHARRLARVFRPDVVIASSTYPMDIWPARRIARAARAKLVHEIHDLWPLSPVELGGMSPRHPFIRVCQAAEDAACRDADVVVSMLPCVREHLRDRTGSTCASSTSCPTACSSQSGVSRSAPLDAALAAHIQEAHAPRAARRRLCRRARHCQRARQPARCRGVAARRGVRVLCSSATAPSASALRRVSRPRVLPACGFSRRSRSARSRACSRRPTSPTSAGSACRSTASASRRTS